MKIKSFRIRAWLTAAVVGLATIFSPAIVAAQDAAPTLTTMPTNAVVTAASSIESGMTGILSQLMPFVVSVLLAGVAIWAAPAIIGVLKRAFTSGKGR